jgi:hypothetical protein
MNPAFYMMLLRQTTNNFLFVMDCNAGLHPLPFTSSAI